MFIGSRYENSMFAVTQSDNKITIDSKGEKLTVKIRIPEYVENFKLLSDGKPLGYKIQNGYAVVEGVWDKRNALILSYEKSVCRIYANPKVAENIGKVAVMYGPYVMCAEGIDNGGKVDFEISENPEFLVENDCIYGKSAQGERFCMIPYYRWCNRGEGEADAKMAVWFKQENMFDIDSLAQKIGDKLYAVYK